MVKRVSILGSTGSIGENTLDIIRRAEKGRFQVVSLTANKNVERLAEQALEFGAEFVGLADESGLSDLKNRLRGSGVKIGAGETALIEAASIPVDFTMAAIIGSAGLEPTLQAVEQGIHVGLANKECLVCAGDYFMNRVKHSGATLLPVDSEHNAIFQVLENDNPKGVRRLILTASGGPFRELDVAKISIDSATLMNKGLELIEASYLFGRPSSEIDIIVHPQSIIHSMVEYVDGSVLAQMGSPDMRTPIAYALAWPRRMDAPVERLDLTRLAGLTFFPPDDVKFPCLRLARAALEAGGKAPCVLNAANEVAVAAFLAGQVGFLDIAKIVENTLSDHAAKSCFSDCGVDVRDIIETDRSARRTAHEQIVSL